MKKSSIPFFAIACILVISCNKEFSHNNGSTNDDQLLMRVVYREGNDSVSTIFKYDSFKRIIEEHSTVISTKNGIPKLLRFHKIYKRNPTGNIIQMASKADQPSDDGKMYDTTFTNITYNTNHKILLKKTTSIAPGVLKTDSAVFIYNSTGKVSRTDSYNSSQPGAILVHTINTMDYDANENIILYKQFSDINGTNRLDITYNFEYDSKANPFPHVHDLNPENWLFTSASNTTRQKVTIASTGDTYTNLTTYDKYNTNGTPVSATHLRGDGSNTITKMYFYYQ